MGASTVGERLASPRVPTSNKGRDVLGLAIPLWAFIGTCREAGGHQKLHGSTVTAVQKWTVSKAREVMEPWPPGWQCLWRGFVFKARGWRG